MSGWTLLGGWLCGAAGAASYISLFRNPGAGFWLVLSLIGLICMLVDTLQGLIQ